MFRRGRGTSVKEAVNDQALALLSLSGGSPGDGTVLIAQDRDEVVGVGVLRLGGPDAEVLALVTDPNHRHRGIGRALVAAMSARARASGAARLRVRLARRDDAAVAFFRALGFDDTHLALDLPL